MSVLGVSLAYAFFRMMYIKSSDWSHRLYVWGLDILAILLTIGRLNFRQLLWHLIVRKSEVLHPTTILIVECLSAVEILYQNECKL